MAMAGEWSPQLTPGRSSQRVLSSVMHLSPPPLPPVPAAVLRRMEALEAEYSEWNSPRALCSSRSSSPRKVATSIDMEEQKTSFDGMDAPRTPQRVPNPSIGIIAALDHTADQCAVSVSKHELKEFKSQLCTELKDTVNSEVASLVDQRMFGELKSQLYTELKNTLHYELTTLVNQRVLMELKGQLYTELKDTVYCEVEQQLHVNLQDLLVGYVRKFDSLHDLVVALESQLGLLLSEIAAVKNQHEIEMSAFRQNVHELRQRFSQWRQDTVVNAMSQNDNKVNGKIMVDIVSLEEEGGLEFYNQVSEQWDSNTDVGHDVSRSLNKAFQNMSRTLSKKERTEVADGAIAEALKTQKVLDDALNSLKPDIDRDSVVLRHAVEAIVKMSEGNITVLEATIDECMRRVSESILALARKRSFHVEAASSNGPTRMVSRYITVLFEHVALAANEMAIPAGELYALPHAAQDCVRRLWDHVPADLISYGDSGGGLQEKLKVQKEVERIFSLIV